MEINDKKLTKETIKDIQITVSLAPLVKALVWRFKLIGWVMKALQLVTGIQFQIIHETPEDEQKGGQA